MILNYNNSHFLAGTITLKDLDNLLKVAVLGPTSLTIRLKFVETILPSYGAPLAGMSKWKLSKPADPYAP